MFFGTQNQDGISKALGLHLPFFVSTTARFPHTVEYMYLTSIGMMLGADPDVDSPPASPPPATCATGYLVG